MEKLPFDLLPLILERVSEGRDRKSCSAVCKLWYFTEALTRVRIRILVCIKCPRQIPNFLCRFTNLTVLEMDTRMSDETLKFLSTTFPQLQTLNLSHDQNPISTCLPTAADFGDKGLSAVAERCTELKVVSLHLRPNVTDSGIVAFQCYGRNLTSLDLSKCWGLTDASLAVAAGMDSLARLNISECSRVTDRGLDFLSSGPAAESLRVLDISYCHGITDVGVCLLQRLSLLEELILRSSGRLQLTDAIGVAVASISSIWKLDLSNQKHITDDTLVSIGNSYIDLAVLDLSNCGSITDASLAIVAGMGSLSQLSITSCRNVTDCGLDFLSTGPAARSLRVLDISCCEQITDVGVCHLKRLSCLEELCLHNYWRIHMRQELTNVAGVAIASISTLRKLDLSKRNHITDATVIALANNCRNMVEIRLHRCRGVMDQGLLYLASRSQLETIHTPCLVHLKEFSSFYVMDITVLCPSLRLLEVDLDIKKWFTPSQLETLNGICKVQWVRCCI